MLAAGSLSSVLTRCRRTGIRLRRLLLGLIFLLAALLGIGEQITRARLVHTSRLHGQRQLFERMLFGELTLLSDSDHGIRQDGLRAERTRRRSLALHRHHTGGGLARSGIALTGIRAGNRMPGGGRLLLHCFLPRLGLKLIIRRIPIHGLLRLSAGELRHMQRGVAQLT